MLTSEKLVGILRENYPYLVAEFGIKRIGLFGSYVKGRASEESDVDVFVEFERPTGFKFIELAEYLESLWAERLTCSLLPASKGSESSESLKTLQIASCMSERTDSDFLSDIQEAIRRIGAYTTGITWGIIQGGDS